MSTVSEPVSDMLMTVKSREVQRGMLAEMRGDRPSAARHLLAAAHLELVLAADFESSGEPELAVRSRMSTASCFSHHGDPETARGLIRNMIETYPESVVMIRELEAESREAFLRDRDPASVGLTVNCAT